MSKHTVFMRIQGQILVGKTFETGDLACTAALELNHHQLQNGFEGYYFVMDNYTAKCNGLLD